MLTFKFKIHCPRDFDTTSAAINYFERPENKVQFVPFNGCEFCHACAECDFCQLQVTKYFSKRNELFALPTPLDPQLL